MKLRVKRVRVKKVRVKVKGIRVRRKNLRVILSRLIKSFPCSGRHSLLPIATMIISEKNRREISKYLFQEGVCYAKKDYNLAKHPDIDVPNLQVIKLMQSFKSKEYVRETFAWMHYYWYLTNDGIEFLRNYLNLPSEIVPNTLKRASRPGPAGGRPFGGPPGDRPR